MGTFYKLCEQWQGSHSWLKQLSESNLENISHLDSYGIKRGMGN